ncbi:LutC/YkgG family protein [Saccharicrinis sp. GN24d3]|uniref:LutC/YkgG family protein n=1 Tax=Saccharicrinis sp. GN24d3 TaxID=3458416 RepID=UPI00403744D3
MDSGKSREAILSKLKKSLEEGRGYPVPPHDINTPVFPVPKNLLSTFSEELTAIGGHVICHDNHKELVAHIEQICEDYGTNQVYCLDTAIQRQLATAAFDVKSGGEDFKAMQVGVTACEFLIARTGTVVVSSAHASGRKMNVFPPVHIVLAKASQLVAFAEDTLELLEKRYSDDFPSLISFITGASRTADIEKTLVMGAHGPKELFVFIDKNE